MREKGQARKMGVGQSNKVKILKLSQNILESLQICFLSWSETLSECG